MAKLNLTERELQILMIGLTYILSSDEDPNETKREADVILQKLQQSLILAKKENPK